MKKPYTEISVNKETRETLSISSKDTLLYHLNKIEKGLNELNPYKEDYYSKERELRERISNLIHNVKKYS